MPIPSPWGTITEHRYRDGSIGFRLRGPIDGKRESCGIYDTIEEAREQAAAYLERLGPRATGLTLGAFGEKWLERRELDGRHRSVHSMAAVWRTYIAPAPIASVPVRGIRPRDVRQWVNSLEGRRATKGRRKGEPLHQQTIKNALHLLSQAFEGAIVAGKCDANPCAGVRVRKVARTVEPWTWLTKDEVSKLLAYVEPAKSQRSRWRAMRTVLVVAIYTGLRTGELWGLRWEDVHLDGVDPWIRVRFGNAKGDPPKSGLPRSVPLLPPAVEALSAWRIRGGVDRRFGPVFPGQRKEKHVSGYDHGWAKTWRARTGTRPDVRLHDMRHTCAAHLIQGTWGRAWRLEDVQQLLGHRSRSTTERYAHLAPGSLHTVAAETRASWTPVGHHEK